MSHDPLGRVIKYRRQAWQRSRSITRRIWDARSGKYSHVTRVKANEWVFIAGMLSAGENFDAQCAGVFGRIEEALRSAGADWANVEIEHTALLLDWDDVRVNLLKRNRKLVNLHRRYVTAAAASRPVPAAAPAPESTRPRARAIRSIRWRGGSRRA